MNLDSLRFFRNRTKQITCPSCSNSSKQQSSKIAKNQTLICAHCGHYFTLTQRDKEKIS
ncbi:YnfU family zinc-binding protein [Winslowiella toletana]